MAQKLILDAPPSCVEFCAIYPQYFLVGTYCLEEDDERALPGRQTRNGSIIVFQLEGLKITHLQTIDQPSAVLDLHFQTSNGKQNVLAVASSTATLSIFRLLPERLPAAVLEPVEVIRIPGIGEDVLFLSCSWHSSIPDLVAVSTSTGAVFVCNVQQRQGSSSSPLSPVILHELEAWTVAFSPFLEQLPSLSNQDARRTNNHTHGTHSTSSGQPDESDPLVALRVYSGSDDSTLQYTTCSLVTAPEVAVCRITTHAAGVTAILPLHLKISDGGHIVATGSYDEQIRIFSVPSPSNTGKGGPARCLAEKNLGGGVWRLKLVRLSKEDCCGKWNIDILASCMHAGARIVNVRFNENGHCRVTVTHHFEEHQSMNYGSDFQPGSSLVCVSTSFYDKLLCVWEVKDIP